MADERWFDVAYIARLLDVHPDTVRDWLREGRLVGRSFGGRTGWRVKESDLNAFLAGDEGKAVA
jgi:excisionase family DNA binding protein